MESAVTGPYGEASRAGGEAGFWQRSPSSEPEELTGALSLPDVAFAAGPEFLPVLLPVVLIREGLTRGKHSCLCHSSGRLRHTRVHTCTPNLHMLLTRSLFIKTTRICSFHRGQTSKISLMGRKSRCQQGRFLEARGESPFPCPC